MEQFKEESNYVKVIHEPFINEELFEKIQCIMDGNVNAAGFNVKNVV